MPQFHTDLGMQATAPERSVLAMAERWRDDTRQHECPMCEGEREGDRWRHDPACPLGRRR
jgi:hypothetical protein